MGLSIDAARTALRSDDERVRHQGVAELTVDPNGDLGDSLELLIEAMGDASWRVRKEAVLRLRGWPDAGLAARALTSALAEPENVGRRNAVVDAVIGLGSAAVDELAAALHARPAHRKLLLDALGMIGDARGASAVAVVLDDPDLNVRVAAAEALGRIGGEEVLSLLREGLAAPEPLLKLASLEGLNRMDARLPYEALAPLEEIGVLRGAVLAALGRSGDARAIAPLCAALGGESRTVREAATVGLAALWGRIDAGRRDELVERLRAVPGLLEPLEIALEEGAAAVRQAAARLLGLSGRPEAVASLVRALGEVELRGAATVALAMLGSVAVAPLVAITPELEAQLRGEVYALLPTLGEGTAEPRVEGLLVNALEDEDEEAAAAAAVALGQLGGRTSLPALFRALERTDGGASAAAAAIGQLGARHYDQIRMLIAARGLDGPEASHLCRILGVCGRAEDAGFLRVALGADDPRVRRAAAEAIGRMPDSPELDESLLFALADEAAEVRSAAAGALGRHHRSSAVEPLAQAVRDPEAVVRATASAALGELASGGTGPERERALELVRSLARGTDAASAVPAVEALGRSNDPADDALLIAALGAGDPEVVKAGALALGGRRSAPRDLAAREALTRALLDGRWDVRRAAAQALAEHGKAAQPILFARRQVESDALVVEALDRALERAVAGDEAKGDTGAGR